MSDAANYRWWQGAVLYQLYVRSWRDSGGDGHGDLAGITGSLDYLSWLGVDGIWLSPTMPSPDADWGYDVSDYRGVHPDFGSLADLDALLAAAGRRGLRVLLDLVPGHTSTAHPWFTDAATGRGAAHRDYYLWADPAPGGGPPNNWLDSTGGPAWALQGASGQYYLHSFLASQADLNWRSPAVHEEFRQILRFWLDRGVAGFRVDVAHGLYKDALLRDNPPLDGPPDPLRGSFGQSPVYSSNRPETHGVYRDWRAVADGYRPPALLLGETWVGDLDAMAAFYGDDSELQLAFNFPFIFAPLAEPALAGLVTQTLAALPGGACPVWAASNHDVGRFPTRWCGGDERKVRLALMVLATLPGSTVLYYGDEIGMTDVEVPPERQRDEMSRAAARDPGGWRGGRDRARTPMQWDASPGAGFTAGPARPWLPLGDTAACNVAGQRADPGSVLHLCRDLLALRRSAQRGRVVGYRRLPAPGGVWAYQVGDLTVTANLSDLERPLPGAAGQGAAVLLTTSGRPAGERAGAQRRALRPWEGVVAGPPAASGGPPGRG